MDNKRLDYIDVAKGIGILLVILGHVYIPPVFHKLIYAFHMPLFFIIAGYTFNIEKYKSYTFKSFFMKKFTAYIVPYFLYAIINFFIFGIAKSLITYGFTKNFIVKNLKYLYGILYSIGSIEYMPNCSPLWFLTCLFVCEIMFFLIIKYSNRMLFWIIFLLFSNIALVHFQIPKLPWNVDTATIGISFMYIGVLIKNNPKITMPYSLIITIPLFISSTLLNSEVNLASMQFGNYIYMYVSAVSGSLATFSISKLLKRFNFFKFYGKNTMCIIGFNYALNSIFSLYGAYVTIWYHWIWVYINVVFLATILILLIQLLKSNTKTHKIFTYL